MTDHGFSLLLVFAGPIVGFVLGRLSRPRSQRRWTGSVPRRLVQGGYQAPPGPRPKPPTGGSGVRRPRTPPSDVKPAPNPPVLSPTKGLFSRFVDCFPNLTTITPAEAHALDAECCRRAVRAGYQPPRSGVYTPTTVKDIPPGIVPPPSSNV